MEPETMILVWAAIAVVNLAFWAWVLSRWFAFMRDVEAKLSQLAESASSAAKACERTAKACEKLAAGE